jgi:hypothetical protein
MAYQAHHGRLARVYIDVTSAGTQAVGTSTLTQIDGENAWTFDQSRDFVDTTSFGDSSKTSVAGLSDATGDITGIFNTVGSGTLVPNIFNSSAERGMMVFPDFTNNPGWYFSGKANFSNKSAGGVTSAVTLDLHFEAGPSGITWTGP